MYVEYRRNKATGKTEREYYLLYRNSQSENIQF